MSRTMSKSSINDVNSPKLAAYIDEIKARLDDNNLVDSLVKELALLRLINDERYEALQERVTAMKAHMTMRDILLPTAQSHYEGSKQVKIEAAMPITAAQGFYAIEHTKKGEPFRWTGPEKSFFFDLHLCRSVALTFTLTLARWGTAPSNPIRCFSDNCEIVLTKNLTDTLIKYSAVLLPRRGDFVGVTRLEFLVADMFRPNPNDVASPLLGVVFNQFTVDAATDVEIEAYLDTFNRHTVQDAPTHINVASS